MTLAVDLGQSNHRLPAEGERAVAVSREPPGAVLVARVPRRPTEASGTVWLSDVRCPTRCAVDARIPDMCRPARLMYTAAGDGMQGSRPNETAADRPAANSAKCDMGPRGIGRCRRLSSSDKARC